VLLLPGSTCWRLETAGRAAFISDMADYFRAARAAMMRAKRSIHLLNWAFDPDTPFDPGEADEGRWDARFGPFLRALACERADLDVRVLCWRSALPVAATQNFFPHRAKACFAGTPVQFRLDSSLPMGACHHQKALVIDDAMAFVGGGDIAPDRWDTVEHRDADPRRLKPQGGAYPSRHEAMAAVDGAAARALGDLFRERWARACGARPGEGGRIPAEAFSTPSEPSDTRDAEDHWPPELKPTAVRVRAGLSRTEPLWHGFQEVREAETLHLAAIAAAKRCIYMENQYFASPVIAEALAARLGERDGPEVVLVSTQRSPSWFDRMTMDRTRVLFLRRLKSVDRYDRCRAYYPLTRQGRPIIVHSKVTIIDDVLLRIGSANLNNRSMGFDTECDLAVEAQDGAAGEPLRAAILGFLLRLLSHWLDAGPEALAEAVAAFGSVHRAIERFDGPGRRLHPIDLLPVGAFWSLVAAYHLGDPAGPPDSWRPWRRRRELEGQLKTLAARIADAGLSPPVDVLSRETV